MWLIVVDVAGEIVMGGEEERLWRELRLVTWVNDV